MEHRNNPAWRLYRILMAGREFPRDRPARDALATILNVPGALPGDVSLLYRRFGKLVALRDTIECQARRTHHFEEAIHLRWAGPMDRAISEFNPAAAWSGFINHFDDAALLSLRSCSNVLAHAMPEELIQEETLQTIRAEAQALAQEVWDCDLPESLKFFILKQLQVIIDAVDEYPICGPQALKDAVATVTGSYGLEPDENKQQLVKDGRWRQLVQIARDMLLLLNLANSIGDLLPTWQANLLSAPPAARDAGDADTPAIECRVSDDGAPSLRPS